MRCPKCHTDNPDTSRFCGSCAAVLSSEGEPPVSLTKTIQTPAHVLAKDTLIAGKYRIVEEIGRGGMGVVYKAEDIKLKRPVALKFLPHQWVSDPDARERFVQEARAASALDHPNICNIYEIGEADDDRMYIAMAFYEGESLRDKIKRGPIKQEEAVGIAIQAATGMAKAHQKGIVHRDIKPANLLITTDGVAKVVDFGLAKLAGQVKLTREGTTVGTVAYMSPEQAKGEAVDQRTDIWSLGVVLYEMLAGVLPFKGDYEQTLIHSILQREPERLVKLRKDLLPGLENIVFKTLSKKPSDRYQSMDELLEDLRAVAEGMKPPRAKAGLFRGRILGIRKPAFYGGVAVLTAAAALIVFAIIIPSPRDNALMAILPVINETGDAEREYFANGLTGELITEFFKVAAMTVRSAESVRPFKGTEKTSKQIAQELKVKTLVRVYWSVAGTRNRLRYEVVDPFRNKLIATDNLEREGEDILYLRSEFARAVVAAIKVAITPAEQKLLTGGQKVNPEAYDLYMRGYVAKQLSDSYTEALSYFEQAIKADPNLALAHAHLGALYSEMGIMSYMPEKEAYAKARTAVEMALEIDNTLAFAHSMKGWLRWIIDWDFAGAESDMKKALELEPGNRDIQLYYAVFLRVMGRHDESIKAFTNLRRSLLPGQGDMLASAYLWAGRVDEGVEIAEKIYQKYPTDFHKYWLAGAYTLSGNYPRAISLYDELMANPEYGEYVPVDLATAYALSGKREEGLAEMNKAKAIYDEKGIEGEFYLACCHAALGETDKAIDLLSQAYENRSGAMVNLKTYPFLYSLHGDPRFEELVKKMGFPEVSRR